MGCGWAVVGLRLGCGWAVVGLMVGLWLGCGWAVVGLATLAKESKTAPAVPVQRDAGDVVWQYIRSEVTTLKTMLPLLAKALCCLSSRLLSRICLPIYLHVHLLV